MAIYYVSTGGTDSNIGSFEQPWGTWQKGFESAQSGDTVYFRGGIYYPTSVHPSEAVIVKVAPYDNQPIGHDGSINAPIRMFAYPSDFLAGNFPILDCSLVLVPVQFLTGISLNRCNFWHLKGLKLRNVNQSQISTVNGIMNYAGSNNTFENMDVYNIGGKGFLTQTHFQMLDESGNTVYSEQMSLTEDVTRFINCDAWNCQDSIARESGRTDFGNYADGFWINCNSTITRVEISGCRSWYNSDDGYDMPIYGTAIVTNCWAFDNGHLVAGSGSGIRNDPNITGMDPWTISNCISAFNKTVGFTVGYPNYPLQPINFYHNFSYKNWYGIIMYGGKSGPEQLNRYYNNIIYDSTEFDLLKGTPIPMNHHSNNYWGTKFEFLNDQENNYMAIPDGSVTGVTDADFISLDMTQLSRPRKADGSLPEITFGHLTTTTSLRGAGIDVNSLPNEGSPWNTISTDGEGNPWNTIPSIGPFEYTGNIKYVSTGGTDSNSGTISEPWGTWQKAFTTSNSGDTVYFRGGTWFPTPAYGNSITLISPIGFLGYPTIGHSGVSGNTIKYFNYPGETPILDCSMVDLTGRTFNNGISVFGAEYIHFKGLEIKNVFQPTISLEIAMGINNVGSANMIFENLTIHDIGGRGMWYGGGAWTILDGPNSPFAFDESYFINCDFYDLCDSISTNYGNGADGIKGHSYEGNIYHFEGCRVWNYSDDGLDISGQGKRYFNKCWFMSTEKYAAGGIEGNGLKVGGANPTYMTSTNPLVFGNLFTVTNCIAAYCHSAGFYDLDYVPYIRSNGRFYNNIAYHCGTGYYGIASNPYTRTTTYNNNIAYESTNLGIMSEPMSATLQVNAYPESNNTWRWHDPSPGSWPFFYEDIIISNSDFVSLDETQLTRPRKSDGSLPDITFGHLTESSLLRSAGINIGLTLDGEGKSWNNPPSIGAFEYPFNPIIRSTPKKLLLTNNKVFIVNGQIMIIS